MKKRASLAFVSGCLGAIATYALVRVAQKVFMDEPDPALVFYSEHAGFFWRAWTAAYAGGTFAFLGWLAAARDEARTARVLERAVVPVLAAATLQGVLVP